MSYEGAVVDLGGADVTPEFVLKSLGSVEEIFET
jgi:hypothetical protein